MSDESPIGKTLGHFQLIQELGRGGMGVVYRAYQPSLAREVAIKVLPEWLARQPGFTERFMVEARSAAKLRHANIVTIHDFGEAGDDRYIVMELLSGQSLAQLMRAEARLDPTRVVKVAAQVGQALDFAHAAGVVHRDVKPANVMIGPRDHATLTDFGIARIADGTTGLTSSGAVLGTPYYMAPEQIEGKTVTSAVDRYAFGVVLFEMLAGQPPFPGETPIRVLMSHVSTPPPLLSQFRADLPRHLDGIFVRALAKDPAARFPTCEALVDAVSGVLTGSWPVSDEPPTVSPGQRPVLAGVSGPTDGGSAYALEGTSGSGGIRRFAAVGIVALLVAAVFAINLITHRKPDSPALVPTATSVTSLEGAVLAPPTAASTERTAATAALPPPSPTAVPPSPTPPLPTDTPVPPTPTEVPPTATEALASPTEPPPSPTTVPATVTVPPTTLATSAPTSAVTIQTGPANNAKSGHGLLVVTLQSIDHPITNKEVDVYQAKKDVLGKTVTGDQVGRSYTDNAGLVSFDLAPGSYVVTSGFSGYNWGTLENSGSQGQADVPVIAGQQTTLQIRLGRLTFTAATVDAGIQNKRVNIRLTRKDVNGNLVSGSDVASGYTDNTGEVSFDLTPGVYEVASDATGYNWGTLSDADGTGNVAVAPGKESTVNLRLGRVVVVVKDASGKVLVNQRVDVRFQGKDSNGQPIAGNGATSGYTDNTGTWHADLSPGIYAVTVNSQTKFNVALEAGKTITVTP